jgi:hypothetical protein
MVCRRRRTIVTPSGLSSSDAIFASNLFGAIPIDDDSPVAARTASLIDCASTRTPVWTSAVSRATFGGGSTS